MKIGVMGAGAVGCYYGAMLARAGHDVTLIARGAHADAVQAHGLLLETKSFQERLRVQATREPSGLRGAELVLFSVKSQDTERAGADMRPFLEARASIVSLQNGVDNAERLAAALGRPVIAAAVYVATEMAGPGHVRHHGRGELVIGAGPESERIAGAFRAAGVPVEVSENVAGVLWTKLIINCAYNALSALANLPYGKLVQGAGIPQVMRDVVEECLAVAQAAGVKVPGGMQEAVARIAETMPAQFSSTAQDLAKGKPSEIDHLNGLVVRKGEALGVATPVNRALHALVKLRESAPR
ncbi:MAG: ketopantoate reductase family protein [Clostridia bacterium]